MTVDERIVLAQLANEVLCGVVLVLEEDLFELEELHFDIFVLGGDNINCTFACQEVLFVESVWVWKTNILANCFNALLNFAGEAFVVVLNDGEVWVTNPGVYQFLVKSYSFIDSLTSCLVVGIGEELGCTFGSCDKMHDSIVPPVSQLNCVPSCFVKKSLPDMLVDVCASIHHSSVTQNDCFHL